MGRNATGTLEPSAGGYGTVNDGENGGSDGT